jgi:hypothetical protein
VILGGTVGARAAPRPQPIVSRLARTAPDLLAAANMPRPSGPRPTGRRDVLALLTDRPIAERYLGSHGSTAQRLQRARARWGVPLAPPRRMHDGVIRQPFDTMVLQRRPHRNAPVRLSLVGHIAAEAGLVPPAARRPRPVPKLLTPEPPALPSGIGPFLIALAVVLGVVGAVTAGGAVRRRRVAVARPRNRVLITRSVLAAPRNSTPAVYQYFARDPDRPIECTSVVVADPLEDPAVHFLESAVLPTYARALVELQEVVTFPAAGATRRFGRRCRELRLVHRSAPFDHYPHRRR